MAAVPRGTRERIADELGRNRPIGAIKMLRDALPGLGLREAKDVIDGLGRPGMPAGATKLASGKVDKGGTVLTLYRDGTFTMTGLFRTSEPDRLLAFATDIDSMRRKSLTGRGAAAVVTGGMSILASNNRGVVYVTITGERSGTKTYTTRNPEDKLLSTIRSLEVAAASLLASPTTAADAVAPNESGAVAPQPAGDVATQLKVIAELHASGALSDDEFAAAKARILS